MERYGDLARRERRPCRRVDGDCRPREEVPRGVSPNGVPRPVELGVRGVHCDGRRVALDLAEREHLRHVEERREGIFPESPPMAPHAEVIYARSRFIGVMPGISDVDLLQKLQQAVAAGRVYNQAELAEILGVNQSSVRRIMQEVEIAQALPKISVQRKEPGAQIRYAIYFVPKQE